MFDFDTVIERRGTDSQKWHRYRGKDILPMWLADMDFASPPAVIEALHERAAHGIFGYAEPSDELIETICSHLQRLYDWTIDPEWLLWTPGMVCALNGACRGLCTEQDEVMTAVPIYPPFLSAPRYMHRPVVKVPMQLDGGAWKFDFDALEAAVTPQTRLFILCNPHNPVGREHRREDLEQLAEFCLRHDIMICSDEIHCDLILDDVEHIPTATLGAEVAQRTITLMAPSKTFNLPGLGCSFAIIPDAEVRRKFEWATNGIVPEVTAFGYAACLAGFRHGEPWRQALLDYLRGNRDYLEDFVRDELPGISMTHVEATYLAWLDVRELDIEKPVAFFEEAGVGLGEGRAFGGPGYLRLTFGCPRSLLEQGLERMKLGLAQA